MVDLPQYPRRLVTSEAPRSSLSPADIAAPYAAMSRGMDQAGDGLNEVAKSYAEQAGAEAVTIGADGQPQVAKAYIVGDAGKVFTRAVSVAAATQADTESERHLLDLREQFRDDPKGFSTAADAYRQEKKSQYSSAAGPMVGLTVDRTIASKSTQIYGGLMAQKQSRDIARSGEAIDARLTSLSDDMEALARNGGVNTGAFKERVQNFDALLNEKVNNPAFHFPSEKADLVRDTVLTRAQGAAVLDQVEQVYRKQGYEAARDHLRASVRDMGASLKAGDKIEMAGRKWLRDEETTFRADRDAITRDWSAAKPQAPTLPRESLISMRDQARAVGNQRVATDIQATLGALDIVSDLRGMPASDRATVAVTGLLPQDLSTGQREVQASIENEARRQGVDPKVAVALAWRESSLGANRGTDPEKAGGVFSLLKSNRQQYGLADGASTEDEVRAGVKFVKDTTDQLRTKLGRDLTPGEIHMGHFQGVGGAAAIIRASPDASLRTTLNGVQSGLGDKVIAANPFLEKYQTVGEFRSWADRAMGGGAGSADLTQSRSGLLALGMMKKDMAGEIGREITDLKDAIKREELPPLDQVTTLGEKVYAIGTPEQKQQIAELLATARVGQQFSQLPAAQREQALSEADAELKAGSPRFDRKLRDTLAGADKQIVGAYKTDPYGAFYRYSRADAAKPTPAVDFNQPDMAAAISDIRVKQQGVIRAQEGMGPLSVLRPAEAEAFRGTLSQTDGKGAAAIFGVLGRLPDDVLGATLSDPKVKEAVQGAARSTDPAKYNATMTALDAFSARDPVRFARMFGEDAQHALATWQSNLRYMDPKTLAAERARAEEPQAAAQRKVVEEEGRTLARKTPIADVVKSFDESWFSDPKAPVDSGTLDALKGDYETVYARRFYETRDKDTAAKQTAEMLKGKWKTSDVNGGRLMLRAPEQVYPAIEGSQDWMKPQIEQALAQRLGVPQPGPRMLDRTVAPRDRAQAPTRGQSYEYVLVTDRRTEELAQRYDPAQPISETNVAPSYQVMIRDNRRTNPKWERLESADGRVERFGFDPDPLRTESRGRMEQRLESERPIREMQGRREQYLRNVRESIQGPR